jgi:hypothetical protein
MPVSLKRFAAYAVVLAGFLSLAYGLTTLLAVLNFFNLESAPAAEVLSLLKSRGETVQTALISALIGYLLAVPMMLIITQAAFSDQAGRGMKRHVAFGLVWASLPLRPLWWGAYLTLIPVLLAAHAPGADATMGTATFASYRMIGAVLNTATEDVAVNILGGTWFVLVGLVISRTRNLPRPLGWIGVVIGILYLVSSGELLGFGFGNSGEIIPLIAGVAGPFWLGAAGFLAVRKVF